MITFAKLSDVCQCKELWKICFGDDYSYIDFFFNNRFKENNLLIYKINSQVVSMMFVLDCSLQKYQGKYIYAACTNPNFQSRGLMGEMLTYSKELYKQIDFICLVPGSESLYEFYRRFDFVPYFKRNIISKFSVSSNSEQLTCDEFTKLRLDFVKKYNALSWGIDGTEYVYNEIQFTGGKILKTNTGYIVLRNNEVLEWHCSNYDTENLIGAKGEMLVRTPVNNNEFEYCGMIYTNNQSLFSIDNPYIGLYLD